MILIIIEPYTAVTARAMMPISTNICEGHLNTKPLLYIAGGCRQIATHKQFILDYYRNISSVVAKFPYSEVGWIVRGERAGQSDNDPSSPSTFSENGGLNGHTSRGDGNACSKFDSAVTLTLQIVMQKCRRLLQSAFTEIRLLADYKVCQQLSTDMTVQEAVLELILEATHAPVTGRIAPLWTCLHQMKRLLVEFQASIRELARECVYRR